MIKIIKKRPQVNFNDRVIGVKGDNETAYREFTIDRMQGEIDLADYVPIIEIQPVNKNEPAYYDVLAYEVQDDSIYMRWDIRSHNTKDDGNLEFQIYFGQTDDTSVKVFQTYTDYFAVAKGIDGKEVGETIEPDLFEQAVVRATEQAQASANSAKQAEDALSKIKTPSASAMSVDSTQEASVVVDEVDGKLEFKFEIPKGKNGADGQNGISPTVNISPISNGYRVTIKDVYGAKSFDIMDGKDGLDGKDGDNGYSPIVTVEEIGDGHKVTIVDKDASHEFIVTNGLDGEIGLDGASAYDIATSNGFKGSEEEWLESLKGKDGEDAYPIEIKELQYDYDVYLDANEVYNMTIDKDCNFILPSPQTNKIEQIFIMADIITPEISIKWGTDCFFDRCVPSIIVGECNIIFESNGEEWCVGIVLKGENNEQNNSQNTNNNYIPQKGIDYYTEEDKAEIVEDVFDVISAEYNTEYKGKTLSILGASYDLVNSKYDVNNEDEIWWGMVCKALGMSVLKNNSISGSTVAGDTEKSGCQTRCLDLHIGIENPDVIIIAMGGNDFKNEIPIGTYNGNGDFPTDTSTFREAYAIMLNKITTRYPDAEIFVCTRPYIFECNGDVSFPEKNDSGILFKEWNEAIIDIANLFGVRIIDQTKCGITWQNRRQFGGDYNEETGWVLHPNKWGQAAMANEIIRTMAPWCTTRYPIRENLIPVAVEWELGTIYKGEEQDSNTRLRTVDGIGRNVYTLSCTPDYTMLVCVPLQKGISTPLYYDKFKDTYTTNATGLWSNYFDLREAYNNIGNSEVRIILKRVDDGEITLADTQNVCAKGVIIE